MTKQTSFPSSDEPTVQADMPPIAERPNQPHLFPWLYGLGFLFLTMAILYVWRYPNMPPETPGWQPEVLAVQQKLAAVDSRLGRLEQQPNPPSAADLGKLSARLDALEARISSQAQLATHVDLLSSRIESLSARDQSSLDATKQQLEKTVGEVSTLEKAADRIDAVSARVGRIARLQAATLALAAGQPLGNLPDAPPALSRYAEAAPPTEAQLRLAFPQVERAALAANQPSNSSAPFIERTWERAEDLVTIRRGNDVVVGNAPVIAITRARTALEAGDLTAAVNAISSGNPMVVRAAGEWLAQAKALIEARSALADIAAHA